MERNLKFVRDIPDHTRFLMFKQCVVTAANYGPLLDSCDDDEEVKEQYKQIDLKLLDIMKNVLNIEEYSDEDIKKFAYYSKNNGGLQLILPH